MICLTRSISAALAILLLWAGMASCRRIQPEPPSRLTLDSVIAPPRSVLNVPVYYPVHELEEIINEKLQRKIFDAKLAISDKHDSLMLTISRFRPVTLSYDGDRGLTYNLPVEVEGYLHSRVAGIQIKNKHPVRAKVIVTLFSDLYLDHQWELAPKSRLRDLQWIEEPQINIAGLRFNLKKILEKTIRNNEQKITDALDKSAKTAIRTRVSIGKLWADMQKPIRINRRLVPVWLKADIAGMKGRFLKRSKDTLMIEIGIEASLRTVLDSASAVIKPKPLPPFTRSDADTSGIHAYVHTTVPFAIVNALLRQATDTMRFAFGSREVTIKQVEAYGTPSGIAIQLGLQGSLEADVFLKGTIGFDTLARKMRIENFGFDVHSRQSLVTAADWLVHDEVTDRIKPYLSVPVDSGFALLPALITRGIERGKVGTKLDLHFTGFSMNIHQHLVTRDDIQIILSVKGKADIELQKALFDKRKAAAASVH